MTMEFIAAAAAFEYFFLFSSHLSLQNNSIFNLYKESWSILVMDITDALTYPLNFFHFSFQEF